MKIFIALFALYVALYPMTSSAQGMSIIRDTEIENAMRAWGEPIFKAAGLRPDSVNVVLVNDSTINAFVAGGSNIFMFSGLIEKADFVDEVIGVMAHETGHINGGHLIASRRAMDRASYQSILSSIVGIGTAILTGNGNAASAIIGGGSAVAARGFFSHSRAQESSADQAALSYFERAKLSPEGLLTFMQKLEGEELLPPSQQSQYMRTHPLTRDRVEAMRGGLDRSNYASVHADPALDLQFKRIKAKLIAFRTPQNVPRFYDLRTPTEDTRYAYAIMAYQQKHFDDAIKQFDSLIADYPNDPYFIEMKAQTLRDSGNLPAAETSYRRALKLLGSSNAPLLKTTLAHILIEQNKNDNEAESLLLQSLQTEGRETTPYRLLATIEGRRNNEAAARYYLAEEAALQGRIGESKRLAELALNDKGLSSTLSVKARDLKTYLDGLPDQGN